MRTLHLATLLLFLAILNACNEQSPSNPVAEQQKPGNNSEPNNDDTDTLISPQYIEMKVAEAKSGNLDYKFAGVLVAAAGKAMVKGAGRGPNNGWLNSARDKYDAGLRLYEGGNADQRIIGATALRLGTVYYHLEDHDRAEKLLLKGIALLESSIETDPEEVTTEYAIGLGMLARVYRSENRVQDGCQQFNKASKFAEIHFGTNSGVFKTLDNTRSLFTCSSEATGPTAAYLQFRIFVKTEKYSEAFALLNESARQELRSVAVVVLGMSGVPNSKYKDMSDLEIFTLFMSHQTPHEFKITEESIDEDNATLKALITQGDQTHPITIKMKKNRDRWLIQSTGVAFGE